MQRPLPPVGDKLKKFHFPLMRSLLLLLPILLLLAVEIGQVSGSGNSKSENGLVRSKKHKKKTTNTSNTINTIKKRQQSRSDSDPIDVSHLPDKERRLFKIFNEGTISEIKAVLESPELSKLPTYFDFRYVPMGFVKPEELEIFTLYMQKFRFDCINFPLSARKRFESLDFVNFNFKALTDVISIFWKRKDFFMAILETQKEYILDNFTDFWRSLLVIESYGEFVEGEHLQCRSKCPNVPSAIHWAFHFFTSQDIGQAENISVLIFDAILRVISPQMKPNEVPAFPEGFLKQIVEIRGIDLNIEISENCLALHFLGLTNLPAYYHKLILSHRAIDVNCIIPSTIRSHKHIRCVVPELPLFWHSLIYQNYQALAILWSNKNLHVSPLVISFFKLLRIFLLFLFFSLWDGKNCRKAREIA
jgi:hypothetical protein